MKIIQLTLALLLAAFALPQSAQAAAPGASVRAILITATNQKGPADPRLAAYEAELQRNIPLSSFRFVSDGSANVTGAGRSSINLALGHRVDVEGNKGPDGIKLKIVWTKGATTLMDTGLTLQPGVPAVLGRRSSDDEKETPIILLIAK
jgi:hypothetical protein